MKRTTNPANTRAIVSALRCDYRSLRATAAQLVDTAVAGSERPVAPVMLAFGASRNTAASILRERAKVTKSGAWRR